MRKEFGEPFIFEPGHEKQELIISCQEAQERLSTIREDTELDKLAEATEHLRTCGQCDEWHRDQKPG